MERQTVALEPLVYDEKTGLPKLPDGFAWKVSENVYSGFEDHPDEHTLLVQVAGCEVEELTWFGKLLGTKPKVEWYTMGHEYCRIVRTCANDADDLKSATTQIYNELRDSELKRIKTQKFVGLYPPNSIL